MPWALSIETGNFVNLSKQVQPENRNISGHHFEATFGMNGKPFDCLPTGSGFIPYISSRIILFTDGVEAQSQ